ncbi:MAG TPA: DUF4956 domain-containing protein [Cyclobacteriaceae bacterium]|nr:DUF4956 domain-containing protein [Cyclobacteriaceae bacterium]
MFDLFSSREYYELPSFETAVYSLLLSFVLSTLLALTYQITERGQGYSRNLFQAIVLGSMVTSMVLMAIGDSIARGLGILGAIAIIRFRARMNSPRNVIFIFAALSIGIATGVYGYRIAIAGTLSFCLVSFLLYFSGYGSKLILENILVITAETAVKTENLESVIKSLCDKFYLIRIQRSNKEIRLRYRLTIKKDTSREILAQKLREIEGINNVRITVRENTEAL